MTLDITILLVAFLAMFAWIMEAAVRNQGVIVSLYVYIVDGEIRNLPEWALQKSAYVFVKLFGKPGLSAKFLFRVSAYSIAVNFLLFFFAFGSINVFIDIVAVNNAGSEVLESTKRDIIASFLSMALLGGIHDLLSFSITYWVIVQRRYWFGKIIFDLPLAILLYISSVHVLRASYYAGVLNSEYYWPLLSMLGYDVNFESSGFSSFIYLMKSFLFEDVGGLRFFDVSLLQHTMQPRMSVSTMFPTFAYCVLIVLSTATHLSLILFRTQMEHFLVYVSRLRPGRIAFVCTGLGLLVVFLQSLSKILG